MSGNQSEILEIAGEDGNLLSLPQAVVMAMNCMLRSGQRFPSAARWSVDFLCLTTDQETGLTMFEIRIQPDVPDADSPVVAKAT